MYRRLLPLAVAIMLVLGCGKKKDDESGGAGGGNDGKADGDPNATYTLKFRDPQAGDQVVETESRAGTTDASFAGKAEKQKEDMRIEYTENIIDVSAGSVKPTKLTRAYKTAQKMDKATGNMKALPFEGKTVNIEKKGTLYEFTIDGKRMDAKDSADFSREFARPDKSRNENLLPKNPVKVGESWEIPQASLKSLAGDFPFPLDLNKSKATAKLTRAYMKDGKQWGIITFEMDLAVGLGAPTGGKVSPPGGLSGNVKAGGTMDAVLDGSSRDGTQRMNVKMDVTGKEAGGDLKITADLVQERTIKTVK